MTKNKLIGYKVDLLIIDEIEYCEDISFIEIQPKSIKGKGHIWRSWD